MFGFVLSKQSVVKKTFFFTLGTFISRILGLVRESVLAGVFGATSLLDAFLVANRIPNMLREMLAEGALGAAFTRRYALLKETSPEKAQSLIVSMLALVLGFVGILVCLGIVFAPSLLDLLTLFSPNHTENSVFYSNAVGLTKILFPFILIMALTSVVSGVLHQKERFFVSAVSPVALNLGYILGGLVLSKFFSENFTRELAAFGVDGSLFGLAVGVLLGGIGQGLWQVSVVFKELLPRGKITLFNEDTKAVIYMMGPMILGASAGQINVFVNTNFATSLEEGAVSWLGMAFRILQLPIGLFGVAIAAVILPSLTKKIAETGSNNSESVGKEFQNAVELVVWLMMPFLVATVFASTDIISLLLQGGKFDGRAVSMTSAALSAYGLGVVGYGLIKVFTSYYYATDRASYPMKVSFISIAVNFSVNFFLVEQFRHVGLAYTTAAVFCFNALLLWFGLKNDGLKLERARFKKSIMLALAAAFAAAAACYGLDRFLGSDIRESLGAFFPALQGVYAVKLNSGVLLILKAAAIFLIFAFSGAYYLNMSVLQLGRRFMSKARRR